MQSGTTRCRSKGARSPTSRASNATAKASTRARGSAAWTFTFRSPDAAHDRKTVRRSMTLDPAIADFYKRPGRMSDSAAADDLLADAPTDIAGIVAYVQNLLLHANWARAYRVQLTSERRDEANTRSLAEMLALIHRHDERPLAATRTPNQRMVGNCR